MPLPRRLGNRIATALQQAEMAAAQGPFPNLPMELSYSHAHGRAYVNPRVAAALDSLSIDPVTHVRLIPLRADRLIIVQAAKGDQAGAIKVMRSEGSLAATLFFRSTLRRFAADWPEDEIVILPVSLETVVVDGKPIKVLLVHVKDHRRAPVRRGKKITAPEG